MVGLGPPGVAYTCYTAWEGYSSHDNDEAFGYLKRVIVTPAVYPSLVGSRHFNIQSTGQKSRFVYTRWHQQIAMF